jgi:hypothetical protein
VTATKHRPIADHVKGWSLRFGNGAVFTNPTDTGNPAAPTIEKPRTTGLFLCRGADALTIRSRRKWPKPPWRPLAHHALEDDRA